MSHRTSKIFYILAENNSSPPKALFKNLGHIQKTKYLSGQIEPVNYRSDEKTLDKLCPYPRGDRFVEIALKAPLLS